MGKTRTIAALVAGALAFVALTSCTPANTSTTVNSAARAS